MASFYDIHRDAITRAFVLGTRYPGDSFRVMMLEPLAPPIENGSALPNDTFTTVAFRRLLNDQHEPFGTGDHNAIARWNARHKDTPDNAWDVPDFVGKVGKAP